MPAPPSLVTRMLVLMLAVASPFLASTRAAEPVGSSTFQPPGMWIWDNWFVRDDAGLWHAYYLQLPKAVGMERRWKNNDLYKHVGHAVSTDLTTWRDVGPALVALPGTWNDRHIATGSITRHEGRWWMLFTGRGTKGDGVGLAVSDDLMQWQTEPQPLFPLIDTFGTEHASPFRSQWRGKEYRWVGISDPYILPEPVDGWFYVVLCSRILDVPMEESGCLTLLRSRDLRTWESAGIVAWPRYFERMETPQLWRREGRWYLTFGGVLNTAWLKERQPRMPAPVQGKPTHQNYCYTVADFRREITDDDLSYLAVPKGCYIMKVESLAPGQDVALFTIKEERGSCLSRPYPVRYPAAGGVELEMEKPASGR